MFADTQRINLQRTSATALSRSVAFLLQKVFNAVSARKSCAICMPSSTSDAMGKSDAYMTEYDEVGVNQCINEWVRVRGKAPIIYGVCLMRVCSVGFDT